MNLCIKISKNCFQKLVIKLVNMERIFTIFHYFQETILTDIFNHEISLFPDIYVAPLFNSKNYENIFNRLL